jgi:hypothetical protein
MIAAAPFWTEPFHTGHELNYFQLLDFVVQAPDFRLFQFDSPPFIGIGLSQRFNDFNDPRARLDAFLF